MKISMCKSGLTVLICGLICIPLIVALQDSSVDSSSLVVESSDALDAENASDKIDFTNAKRAFSHKTTHELLLSFMLLQGCAFKCMIENSELVYRIMKKAFGQTLTNFVVGKTFFKNFCGGKDAIELESVMSSISNRGVGQYVEYAVESATEDGQCINDAEDQREDHLKKFLEAITSVSHTTGYQGGGFTAIKVSAMGSIRILDNMSIIIKFIFGKHGGKINQTQLRKRLPELSKPNGNKLFKLIDTNKDGKIDGVDFVSALAKKISSTKVGAILSQLKSFEVSIDDGRLFNTMMDRVNQIATRSFEQNVKLLIDAEWFSITPAIDHIALHFQRSFNRGEKGAIVFTTYQTYLTDSMHRVQSDLLRSEQEGWIWASKCVRGAYMVSERQKAKIANIASPVFDTFEETEVNYHSVLDYVLSFKTDMPIELMVATHNQGTTEHVIEQVQSGNCNSNVKVWFSQLYGMADYITNSLVDHGYKCFKCTPFGPIDEVVPFLIRRAQENSVVLGGPGVKLEFKMIRNELKRRFYSMFTRS